MAAYSANLREINALNQRGGRMLSVVDLIAAGTLDVPTAGYLLAAVTSGASFMTAAGPGGVGKTTVLSSLLGFLPPDERIVTVTDPWRADASDGPTCYLCHEIGGGPVYGYLWGEAAAQFLSLRPSGRIAASLHADSPEEVSAQLLGPNVGADPEDVRAVDLLVLVARIGNMRRVAAVHERTEASPTDGWRRVAAWRPERDGFSVAASPRLRRIFGREAPSLLRRATDCIRELVDEDTRMIEDVVARVAEFHGALGVR